MLCQTELLPDVVAPRDLNDRGRTLLSALAQYPRILNLRSEDTGQSREPAQTHGEQHQTTEWLGEARPENVACDVHD